MVEDRLLKHIFEKIRGYSSGVGDDAAYISMGDKFLLLNAQLFSEGQHFDLDFIYPKDVGYRAVTATISDIIAMAGVPKYIFVCVAMPTADYTFIDSLYEGIEEAAKRFKLKIVGGDLIKSKGERFLAVVTQGVIKKVYLKRRATAKMEDKLYLTDYVGKASCGLEFLRRRRDHPIIEKFLRPHPPIELVKDLQRVATAMIDISDGLSSELYRLTTASGVGARIFKERLLDEELKSAAKELDEDPLRFALHGGEDFQILFTAKDRVEFGIQIGEIIPSGLELIDQKKIEKIHPGGFIQFDATP